jgi:hypothetical protein
MNCNWCHSPILEDARRISGELSVHYWCIDFLESRLQVLDDRLLWRNFIQFLLSMGAVYLRRVRPQLARQSQSQSA